MANRNRTTEKQLPIHMEPLPPLPEDEDPTGGLWRQGIIKIDQREYRPISDDQTIMDLLKKVLGKDHDISLRDLRDMAEGHETAPLPPALQAELNNREVRHQSLMDELRIEFEKCGNPLFAWDAYQLCRKEKRSIPPWVQEYFDATAWRMTGVKNVPKNLPKYFGFPSKSGPGPWRQYFTYVVHREAVALAVHYLRKHQGTTIDDGCAYALEIVRKKWESYHFLWENSKTNVGSIMRWYHRYGK